MVFRLNEDDFEMIQTGIVDDLLTIFPIVFLLVTILVPVYVWIVR